MKNLYLLALSCLMASAAQAQTAVSRPRGLLFFVAFATGIPCV